MAAKICTADEKMRMSCVMFCSLQWVAVSVQSQNSRSSSRYEAVVWVEGIGKGVTVAIASSVPVGISVALTTGSAMIV